MREAVAAVDLPSRLAGPMRNAALGRRLRSATVGDDAHRHTAYGHDDDDDDDDGGGGGGGDKLNGNRGNQG
jgi:hypothetical protein